MKVQQQQHSTREPDRLLVLACSLAAAEGVAARLQARQAVPGRSVNFSSPPAMLNTAALYMNLYTSLLVHSQLFMQQLLTQSQLGPQLLMPASHGGAAHRLFVDRYCTAEESLPMCIGCASL